MNEIDWKRCLNIIEGGENGTPDSLAATIEQIAKGAQGSWLAAAVEKDAPLTFKHPLSSKDFDGHLPTQTCDQAAAALLAKLPNSLSPKALCHLMWRCGADLLPETALTPADPALPDFTVWNHLAARAALANCIVDDEVRPAFLMFQIGPVQEFIAQARSTRDLWSGSYMLSWLMANALNTITDKLGPAAVIFPNLRGNGIFDALHENFYKTAGVWDKLDKPGDIAAWKLTPTLPNRFLALVPADAAEELAKCAEDTIYAELQRLSEPVWKWIDRLATMDLKIPGAELKQWRDRWEAQIADFPKITWAIQPWGKDFDAVLAEYAALPINAPEDREDNRKPPVENLRALLNAVPKEQWNHGMLWSAYYGLVDAKLAARRNTREFDAWKTVNSDNAVKDSLSGKEEVIGNEAFWNYIRKHFSFFAKASGHRYGAMNLVKRLWCRPEALDYHPDNLWKRLGLSAGAFSLAIGMDSTQDVAKKNQNGGGYIAVLAMDGDQMGKWISGEKTPKLNDQLANCRTELEELRRPLTPAYHLQFSEALANFSLWKAAKVVEGHQGQLIYAGGDDVLAMLPADQAIDCAKALQDTFRTDFDGKRLLPGSAGNVSAGLAIGHCDAPLQMLVKEAQNAEHRAKNDYGRAALAISLYKRSGEILQWGCKWDSPAIPLMEFLQNHKGENEITGRFPYALARVLAPYRLEKDQTLSPEDLLDIIEKETEIIIGRQAAGLGEKVREELCNHCREWCQKCAESPEKKKNAKAEGIEEEARDTEEAAKPNHRLADYIMPFLTEAFINRKRGED